MSSTSMMSKIVNSIPSRMQELLESDYVTTHSSEEPELLKKVRRKAQEHLLHPRMVSGHLQGRLLKMLVRMIQPRHVLELGTYSAYATVCLAEGLPQGSKVTTIELNDELEPLIKEVLSKADVSDRVEFIQGDAVQVLEGLPLEEVDLVYLDADKKQYPIYLRMLANRLPIGAFIIADNTLWGGKVYDEAAKDAQTEAIREFNDVVAADERLEKVLLPIRDGLTLIYKLK